MKKRLKLLSQDRLREIAWEVGTKYPIPITGDHLTLLMVSPRLGYLQWRIQEECLESLKLTHGERFEGGRIIVRIYDVTDILFDGFNAHMFFDLEVNKQSGHYYFAMDRLGRDYLAEVGSRFNDGSFHGFARSNTVFFDRDGPSGNYDIAGLFVGGTSNRVFSVENIFDASIYEKMNQALSGINRTESLSVAVVFLRVNDTAGLNSPLGSFIKKSSERIKEFGAHVRLFTTRGNDIRNMQSKSLVESINTVSKRIFRRLTAAHKKTPFHIIHCHDWYSSAIGLSAVKKLNVPMILTLYSTEHQRTGGGKLNRLSSTICRWEERAVQGADLVIVPDSSTQQQVVEIYGAPPKKVVIIRCPLSEDSADDVFNPAEARRWFGLQQDAAVALFAGEISHAAGADLLIDALPTVCRNNRVAQFVFVGEGPLKRELEDRAVYSGIAHRCRFVGDVSREVFEALLMTSDFVVIPARTWQDQGLAQMAIEFGRPVLTTRQAGLDCVVHGENGLVTFDNPGSIVWGIQELLSNPLKGGMLRLAAKKRASGTPSVGNIAAQHYMYYEDILMNFEGAKNA